MAVPTRLRWGFTGLYVVLSMVVACGGGGSVSEDAAPKIDASTPLEECSATCAAPDMCCDLPIGAFCLKTGIDKNNCGACGHVCSPAVADNCAASECKCGFAPACTDGKTCISATVGCRDTMKDPQNCGSPGHQCGPEETCIAGVCSCGGQECTTGQTCCGGACTDTKTDADNCGVCHNVCEGTEDSCVTGSCSCAGGGHCPTTGPDSVGACCPGGSGCQNLCTDEANCGECGHACAAGVTCDLGRCGTEPALHPDLCVIFP
jgi:hypothetical protein